MTKFKIFLTALLAFALSACTSHAEAKKTTNKPVVQHTQTFAKLTGDTYQVNGKTYSTQSHASGHHYAKQGKASYYHSKFNGRRTASGEVYRATQYTAAHKTLPLGSYALVTNLRNNRKVVVKINDRGPYHGSRIIDLSRAAASDLGMVASGVGNVKVERLHVVRN